MRRESLLAEDVACGLGAGRTDFHHPTNGQQTIRIDSTTCSLTPVLRKGFTMAKKKAAAAKKPMTKSEILSSLADSSELSKKEIAGVFEDLAALIAKNLKKSGAGVFTIPGLSKIKVVRKPATKARPGINPFTGEETIFKAKPARNVVKIQPLKALKDMV
jgi:nucleoid DNA-binding protein